MPRVSLTGIEVLEDLLREVRLVHEQIVTARDETCRRHSLKAEDLDSSLREASSRLDSLRAEESRLNSEIDVTSGALESLSAEVDSLESRLQ